MHRRARSLMYDGIYPDHLREGPRKSSGASSAHTALEMCGAGRHREAADLPPHWSLAHLRRLAGQKFEHPAQQIVFQDAINAIEDAVARLRRLGQQLLAIVPSWSMAPVVAAYQAMRGVSFIVAVTFVAEIGDVRRFDSPRQLMAYLGLVPCEHSTGERVRRGSITKTGNSRARRVLVEGAWTYRFPARMSRLLRPRLEGLSQHPGG